MMSESGRSKRAGFALGPGLPGLYRLKPDTFLIVNRV
jgi:hypothetical protein